MIRLSFTSKIPNPNIQMKNYWPLDMNCPICFNIFRTPTVLSCGHTYCKPCIEQLAKVKFGTEECKPSINIYKRFLDLFTRANVKCPECRVDVVISFKTKTNFALQSKFYFSNSQFLILEIIDEHVNSTKDKFECSCGEHVKPSNSWICKTCMNGPKVTFSTFKNIILRI